MRFILSKKKTENYSSFMDTTLSKQVLKGAGHIKS